MTGRITSMKNSRDTIGNQTRELPACSAVPPLALTSHTKRRISCSVERLSASQERSCPVELVNNARPMVGVVKRRMPRDARVWFHCLDTRWGMQEAFQIKGILMR